MSTSSAPKPPKAKAAYRVKPRSRDASTKFSKLKSLKCFNEVHQRILDGWPLSKVATYVQQERQEYTDVTNGSLIAVLQEYRAALPPTVLLSKTPLLPTFGKAMDQLEEGLDELAELERLYKIQMERIQIDFEKEKQIKKLLTSMTPEIRAAKDLLTARAQLKMDLGLDDRHLGTAEVSVEVTATADLGAKYGEQAAKVLDNDTSRRKLLGIANQFLSFANSKRSDAMVKQESLAKLAEDLTSKVAMPAAEAAAAAQAVADDDPEVPSFEFDLDRDPDALPEGDL